MLSLPKHLAEAWFEKRHYLALAEENLNNGNNSAAGKKKEFVSTRFLGFARNDRGGV